MNTYEFVCVLVISRAYNWQGLIACSFVIKVVIHIYVCVYVHISGYVTGVAVVICA